MFKNQKARWMAPEEQHLQLLLVPTCVYTQNEKARHTWEKIFTKHIADSGLMAKIHGKKKS